MLSHPGRVRKGNEDFAGADEKAGVFVVCDGMGGAAGGEIASRLAAETFLAHLQPFSRPGTEIVKGLTKRTADRGQDAPRRATPDIRLDTAIHAANQAIFQASHRAPDLRGMGTTLVALLLEQPDPGLIEVPLSLTLAHVGDSRCYRYRAGELTLLTEDHSLVEEQVRAGELTAYEAQHHPMRNIITRAVGSQASVEPEIRHLEVLPGDLYLLASDGLTRDLTGGDLAAVMQRAYRLPDRRLNLQSLCQTLIDEANDAGGGDNITVLLLRIE